MAPLSLAASFHPRTNWLEQFGISRTGVREALQMMAVLNLIEIRQGLGCFVKRVTPEYIVNADVLAILLEKEAILDVVETRKIVESGTAAMATERGTPEDFWVMEDVLTQIDRTIQRGESVQRSAQNFISRLPRRRITRCLQDWSDRSPI